MLSGIDNLGASLEREEVESVKSSDELVQVKSRPRYLRQRRVSPRTTPSGT
jgi:hypothetical protein